MKLYELHEVVQQLRINKKLVFKIVVIDDGGKIIDKSANIFHNDHYLTVYMWAGSPYIRGLRFYKGEFQDFYAGLQFDERCRWIITNDLDTFFKDSK